MNTTTTTATNIAKLNLSAINPNFIAGLNKCLDLTNKLAKCEIALKDATTDYNNTHGIPATDIEKKDRSSYLASYRKAVKTANNQLEYTASALLSHYIDIDFTKDDIYAFTPSDLESLLRNTGALTGNIKDCKDKQFQTAKDIYKAVKVTLNTVYNRRTTSLTRRNKGNAQLTTKGSKDIKNTYCEYILAIVTGLATDNKVFTLEKAENGDYISIINNFAD